MIEIGPNLKEVLDGILLVVIIYLFGKGLWYAVR